jgi:hypothetical protein
MGASSPAPEIEELQANQALVLLYTVKMQQDGGSESGCASAALSWRFAALSAGARARARALFPAPPRPRPRRCALVMDLMWQISRGPSRERGTWKAKATAAAGRQASSRVTLRLSSSGRSPSRQSRREETGRAQRESAERRGEDSERGEERGRTRSEDADTSRLLA